MKVLFNTVIFKGNLFQDDINKRIKNLEKEFEIVNIQLWDIDENSAKLFIVYKNKEK